MVIAARSNLGTRRVEFHSEDEKLNIMSINVDNLDSVICNISTPHPVASATQYSVSKAVGE